MFLFDLKWKRRGLIVFRFVCTPELESLHFVEILKDTCWGGYFVLRMSYFVLQTLGGAVARAVSPSSQLSLARASAESETAVQQQQANDCTD